MAKLGSLFPPQTATTRDRAKTETFPTNQEITKTNSDDRRLKYHKDQTDSLPVGKQNWTSRQHRSFWAQPTQFTQHQQLNPHCPQKRGRTENKENSCCTVCVQIPTRRSSYLDSLLTAQPPPRSRQENDRDLPHWSECSIFTDLNKVILFSFISSRPINPSTVP